jgi:hypothetical protein
MHVTVGFSGIQSAPIPKCNSEINTFAKAGGEGIEKQKGVPLPRRMDQQVPFRLTLATFG